MLSLLTKFLRDESGSETVEWAIVAALLIVSTAIAWSSLGEEIGHVIDSLIQMLKGTKGTTS